MNLFELIGIFIGDGHIEYNKIYRNYWLEICGNIEEREYFEKISELLFNLTKRKPRIKEKKEKKGMGLRLILANKGFVNFLIKNIGLPSGKKTFSISIPKKFLEWKFSKHILRGIFDTDGSIYFSHSKKGKYPTYPRIEIKTRSEDLAYQIVDILRKNKFNIQIRLSKEKMYVLYLSGQKMADR